MEPRLLIANLLIGATAAVILCVPIALWVRAWLKRRRRRRNRRFAHDRPYFSDMPSSRRAAPPVPATTGDEDGGSHKPSA